MGRVERPCTPSRAKSRRHMGVAKVPMWRFVFASCSVKLHRLGNDWFNVPGARFKGKYRVKSSAGHAADAH